MKHIRKPNYQGSLIEDKVEKMIEEYLVNFDFLATALETYGFVPAPVNEVQRMGFTKPVGSFRDLFTMIRCLV